LCGEILIQPDQQVDEFAAHRRSTKQRGQLRQIDEPARASVMVIARFDDLGKRIEDWVCWNQVGMLQQICVIPAPAAS